MLCAPGCRRSGRIQCCGLRRAAADRLHMKPFEYIAVETIAEACGVLAEHGADTRVLAGGTDLLIEWRRASAKPPKIVLDISRVSALARIFHRAFGFWRLGRILGARVGHGGLFLPRDRWVRREKPVRQATRPFLKTPLLRFLPTVAPFALSPPVRPVASAVDGKGQRALVAGRRCSSAHTLGVRSRAPGRLFLRA